MKNLFALVSAAVLSTAAFAQVQNQHPTIDAIAPENTVFVFGLDDPAGTQKRLGNHPAFAAITDPNAVFEGAGAMLGEQFGEMLDGAEGINLMPQGPVGGAVFVVTDPELGVARPGMLIYGDFGDGAADVMKHLRKAAATAVDKGTAKMNTREVAGNEILTVTFVEAEDEEMDFDDMDMDDPGGDPFGGMMPGPSDLLDQFESVHMVQAGRAVIVGTDLKSITDSLASIGGAERRTLSGNRVFQEVRGQLGPGDAYAVLLSKDLASLVAGADPMGMVMMMTPMLRAAFGEIKGWGYTLAATDGPSPVRHRAAVLMPYGKQGLPRLLDTPGPRSAPPAFVGSDAAGYTSLNVDLDGVVPLVAQVLQSNPMFQMQLGPQWEQYRPIVHQICSALGSNMHMVNAEDGGGVMAIDCRDAAKVRVMLDEASEQLGLIGRDIAGHRVWTMAPNEDPMMQGMGGGMGGGMLNVDGAIALRGEHLFIGDAGDVDDVITGAMPANPLAESPAFRAAMRAMGSEDVVAWGYTDLSQTEGEMAGVNAADMGTTIWWVESTKTGFVMTAQQLQPLRAVNVVTE